MTQLVEDLQVEGVLFGKPHSQEHIDQLGMGRQGADGGPVRSIKVKCQRKTVPGPKFSGQGRVHDYNLRETSGFHMGNPGWLLKSFKRSVWRTGPDIKCPVP